MIDSQLLAFVSMRGDPLRTTQPTDPSTTRAGTRGRQRYALVLALLTPFLTACFDTKPSCDQLDYYESQISEETSKANPDRERVGVLLELRNEAAADC